MSDVQKQKMTGSYKLTRVGVTNVKKPVNVERKGKTVVLSATFDIYVDLPANLKGSHLSRNLEVLSHTIDECIRKPVKGLEELCVNLCKELLLKHEYANCAEAKATAPYFLERTLDGGANSLELYGLTASAFYSRNDKIWKNIGVEVLGMTACPCAMEEVRSLTEPEANNFDKLIITHNQRNKTRLSLQTPENWSVEADELIKIVENSFSSPTHEILKRADEAQIVINAHSNPKFVEDVVRDVLKEVLAKFSSLPDEVTILVDSESYESIHKHNAYAQRETSLGDLRT